MWKPLNSWAGVYEIHPTGKVRRIVAGVTGPKPRKELRTSVAGAGYRQVRLSKLPRRERRYVHQLVLENFGEPQCEGCEPDHKDRDKSNNALDNLHWLTHQKNCENRNNGKNIYT